MGILYYFNVLYNVYLFVFLVKCKTLVVFKSKIWPQLFS